MYSTVKRIVLCINVLKSIRKLTTVHDLHNVLKSNTILLGKFLFRKFPKFTCLFRDVLKSIGA